MDAHCPTRSILAVALVALACLGCEKTASRATESSNMKPLAIFYGQYTGSHKGQPPASEEEFKTYLRSIRPETLQSLNVPDTDSLLISPRDKKPYVIRYGKVHGPAGPGGMPVFAYEQDGIAGRRYVATSVGAVAEVDETKFRELVPDTK